MNYQAQITQHAGMAVQWKLIFISLEISHSRFIIDGTGHSGETVQLIERP